jgi:NTP pyrophosphatase (non-canonical NTP hydrolase)
VYRWAFSLQDEFCGHFGSRCLYFFGCKRIFLLLFPWRLLQISERAFKLVVGSLTSRVFAFLIAWTFILSQPDISLRDFQKLIRAMYYEKDAERGVSGTFMWLMEEMGELASALRSNHDRANLEEEFADVVAWLTTIANVAGVDLSAAITSKYGSGCPGCKKLACDCPMSEKP